MHDKADAIALSVRSYFNRVNVARAFVEGYLARPKGAASVAVCPHLLRAIDRDDEDVPFRAGIDDCYECSCVRTGDGTYTARTRAVHAQCRISPRAVSPASTTATAVIAAMTMR
jgi:hypothetical protein